MSVTDTITAYDGGGAENATPLVATFNIVTICANHMDSVILPDDIGNVSVVNGSLKDCAVYPPTDAQIDGLGVNEPYPLASDSLQEFIRVSSTQWYSKNHGLRYVELDPAASQFTHSTLTVQDGTWTDLDLTTIIPPSAYGHPVSFRAAGADASNAIVFQLRKNGNSNAIAVYSMTIPSGGVTYRQNGQIDCDANGLVEYYISAAIDSLGLGVIGYEVEG